MPLDFIARKRYYNRCDPNESLAPGDDRNVDLDACCNEPVRGIRWVERLAGRIELSDKPSFQLFTGLRGSGKSTELRRLTARLERADGAHLLAVYIDAEEVLDLTNPIDIPDIIASILFETEKRLLDAEGKDAERSMQEGYMIRLWNWLTKTDVELTKTEFSIPGGGAKLVAEMKKTATSTAVTLEEEKRQAREEEEEKEREEKEESAALPEQGSESGNRPQQQAGRINVTA